DDGVTVAVGLGAVLDEVLGERRSDAADGAQLLRRDAQHRRQLVGLAQHGEDLAELHRVDAEVLFERRLGIEDLQRIARHLREDALHAAGHLPLVEICADALHGVASRAAVAAVKAVDTVKRVRMASRVAVVSTAPRVLRPAAVTVTSKAVKRSPNSAPMQPARRAARSGGPSTSTARNSHTLRTGAAPDLSAASLTVHRKV